MFVIEINLLTDSSTTVLSDQLPYVVPITESWMLVTKLLNIFYLDTLTDQLL